MAERGGYRPNSGRKPKADEAKLIEKLTPLAPIAHTALSEALENKEQWAVKMFFEYFYGKPKQSIDHTTNGESMPSNLQVTIVPPSNDESES